MCALLEVRWRQRQANGGGGRCGSNRLSLTSIRCPAQRLAMGLESPRAELLMRIDVRVTSPQAKKAALPRISKEGEDTTEVRCREAAMGNPDRVGEEVR